MLTMTQMRNVPPPLARSFVGVGSLILQDGHAEVHSAASRLGRAGRDIAPPAR